MSPAEAIQKIVNELKIKQIKNDLRQLLKEIAEEDAAKTDQSKEPEFKIDGIGFYETSDGRIVFITGCNGWAVYKWKGYHQWGLGVDDDFWEETGKCKSSFNEGYLDIIKKLTFRQGAEN